MADPDNRRQWLAKMSERPMDQVRFVPEADTGIIDSIENGVLFLMAFWSGYSVKAFAALSKVFSTAETESLEFVVADVDGSPSLYEVPEFKERIHGAGETAWIHNRTIIATSGLGLNLESFAPNTSTLLAFCTYGSQVTSAQIAKRFHWLRPWQGIGDRAKMIDTELTKELSEGHSLHGLSVWAIAKRSDCDDVLFAIEGEERLAVVHLTWSGKSESNKNFPLTDIYIGWQDWVDRCLLPEHRSYRETVR